MLSTLLQARPKTIIRFSFECTHLKTYIRTAIPREHTRKIHKIIWVASAECHKPGYPPTCLHFHTRSPNKRRGIRCNGHRPRCGRIHRDILPNRHRPCPHPTKKSDARTPQWGILHFSYSRNHFHSGHVPPRPISS